MFCENCGKKLIRGYNFCVECGTPVPPEQPEEQEIEQVQQMQQESQANKAEEQVQSNQMPGIKPPNSGEGLLVYCPTCGMRMQNSTDICEKCGMPLNPGGANGSVPLENKNPFVGFGGISDSDAADIDSLLGGGSLASEIEALNQQFVNLNSSASAMPEITPVSRESAPQPAPDPQPAPKTDAASSDDSLIHGEFTRRLDNFSMEAGMPETQFLSDSDVPVIIGGEMTEPEVPVELERNYGAIDIEVTSEYKPPVPPPVAVETPVEEDAPAYSEPVAEETAVEEDAPVYSETAYSEPVAEETAVEEAAPAYSETAYSEPVAEETAVEEAAPVYSETAYSEPVEEETPVEEAAPVYSETEYSEPVAEETPVEEAAPVYSETAYSEPVAEETAVEEAAPVYSETAYSEPVAEETPVEEAAPVYSETAYSEPVAEETPVEEAAPAYSEAAYSESVEEETAVEEAAPAYSEAAYNEPVAEETAVEEAAPVYSETAYSEPVEEETPVEEAAPAYAEASYSETTEQTQFVSYSEPQPSVNQAPEAPAEGDVDLGKLVYCRNCGQDMYEKEPFCKNCGSPNKWNEKPLRHAVSGGTQAEKEPAKIFGLIPLKPFVIGVTAVVAVLAIVILPGIIGGKNNDNIVNSGNNSTVTNNNNGNNGDNGDNGDNNSLPDNSQLDPVVVPTEEQTTPPVNEQTEPVESSTPDNGDNSEPEQTTASNTTSDTTKTSTTKKSTADTSDSEPVESTTSTTTTAKTTPKATTTTKSTTPKTTTTKSTTTAKPTDTTPSAVVQNEDKQRAKIMDAFEVISAEVGKLNLYVEASDVAANLGKSRSYYTSEMKSTLSSGKSTAASKYKNARPDTSTLSSAYRALEKMYDAYVAYYDYVTGQNDLSGAYNKLESFNSAVKGFAYSNLTTPKQTDADKSRMYAELMTNAATAGSNAVTQFNSVQGELEQVKNDFGNNAPDKIFLDKKSNILKAAGYAQVVHSYYRILGNDISTAKNALSSLDSDLDSLLSIYITASDHTLSSFKSACKTEVTSANGNVSTINNAV